MSDIISAAVGCAQ